MISALSRGASPAADFLARCLTTFRKCCVCGRHPCSLCKFAGIERNEGTESFLINACTFGTLRMSPFLATRGNFAEPHFLHFFDRSGLPGSCPRKQSWAPGVKRRYERLNETRSSDPSDLDRLGCAKRQPYKDAMSLCAMDGVHNPAAPKSLGRTPCRMISSAHANAE